MCLKIIVVIVLIVFVSSEYVKTSTEEEMDVVLDMLMQNEVHEYTDSVEKTIEEEKLRSLSTEAFLEDGVWKCGKCNNIDESKLVYTETYDIEANYEDDYMDLQVGLSMQNMSCVTITVTSAVMELGQFSVKRVSGDCSGEGATLRVSGTAQYDVRVYE